jgi:hypothetical protein
MTTTCKPKTSNVRQAHLHEAPAIPPPYVVDFVPASDRLGERESARRFEIEQEIRKAAAKRRSSVQLYDPLEDWLYSLVPAAAIIALILGVLGMLDSRSSSGPAMSAAKTAVTERSVPTQGKDGKF